jgi:hypothetical protein
METSMKEFEEPEVKIYKGLRDMGNGYGVRGLCKVWTDNNPLKPTNKYGFEWGEYRGRRCTNLAESILLDCLKEVDPHMVRRFREEFVQQFPFEGWQISEFQVYDFVDRIVLEKEKERKNNNGK